MAGSGFTGTGLLGRLYRGETNVDFIGSRKKWYVASGIIILICLVSIIFRGFNYGIDFAGGEQFQLQVKPGTTLSQMRSAAESAGVTVASAQTAGSGSSQSYVIRTDKIDASKQEAVIAALTKAGDASVSLNDVSSSWGKEVTQQAITALVVFLLVVSAFIWLRFQEWRMAGAALLALLHDLLLTAGVYSIVGFEVTPGTVVGLLTILGFSLYDTVVVFDKVDENSKGLLASTRYTYPEAANLAVNQTLMRSINTSIIGLLPVAGLLFVGAGLLGVGTLEDLALVLFVGMLTGAYSSLFLATPWLVDFKLMDPRYRNHMQRVLSRRGAQRKTADEGTVLVATGKGRREPVRPAAVPADDDASDQDALDNQVTDREDALAATAPRVGAKPPAKRGAGARPGANRPRGNKRR